MPKQRFHNWLDSPFYFILNHHDSSTREYFIDNVCSYLGIKENAKVLDTACGRGENVLHLSKKGYEVTGLDPSYANIKAAKQFEDDHLQFFVHDIRNLFYISYFDVVLNLFTSFSYFRTEKDHINAFKTFRKSLNKDGVVVFDYFNSRNITSSLAPEEVIASGISFQISKEIIDGNLVKMISFEHDDQQYSFAEQHKLFSDQDFERLFQQSGLAVVAKFGDYSLNKFDLSHSDRLIFILKKADDRTTDTI